MILKSDCFPEGQVSFFDLSRELAVLNLLVDAIAVASVVLGPIRAAPNRTGKRVQEFSYFLTLRVVNVVEPHFLGAHLCWGPRIPVCSCLLRQVNCVPLASIALLTSLVQPF